MSSTEQVIATTAALAPAQAPVTGTHPDVVYFDIDSAPGIQLFRCDKLRASLTPAGCASNYRQALRRDAEQLYHCRNCPIGGAHTGQPPVMLSRYYGSNICSRCHRPATRIIRGTICVSCQNREYEIIRGRNAKGRKPVRLTPLYRQRLAVSIEGKPAIRTAARAADLTELMLTVLRNERGRIQFAFPSGQVQGRAQLRLF